MSKFDFPPTTEKVEKPDGLIPKPEEYLASLREKGLDNYAAAYEQVLKLATAINRAGGRAMLVGGCLRDMEMGLVPKDFDIEIYKLTADQVERAARTIGKVDDVGKAFGILKVFCEGGIDLDISLPRTDSKMDFLTEEKKNEHKNFEIKVDPNMSIREAARRRDFTMNSMAADPLTGELYDPYGGREDLKRGVIKITDPERFKDDPLRVLRAVQFIGRLGLSADVRDIGIYQELAPKVNDLPSERLMEEWKKLLLKSDKPSLGLGAGMGLGIFQAIHPEFTELVRTPQEFTWHPEGNVWVHTLMVVDEAAKIVRQEELDEKTALTVMLAALCHDLGKQAVTAMAKTGRVTSHGHESAGEGKTAEFLDRIKAEIKIKDKVVKLVANHLAPSMLYVEWVIKGKKVNDGAIRRLAARIAPATIQELVAVAKADHFGRGPFPASIREQQLLKPDEFKPGEWLLEKARALSVEDSKPQPLIGGKDLIALGYKPGKDFGELIQLADDLRDDLDYDKEAVIKEIINIKNAKEAIEKLKSLLPKKE